MKCISTDAAPQAIGPYSQGILAGDTLYVSGQLGIDPESGELLPTLPKQAERALRNIEAIAKESGLSLGKVVKLTVYLSDMEMFAELNEVMSRILSEPYPARACVECSRLPKGALVEIDAVVSR